MTVREIGANIRRNRLCYLFIAPFFILFFIFTVMPVLASIGLGFTYYNVLQPPSLVGLSNYAKMLFADDIFMKAAMNTAIMAAIIGPGGYLISLMLAWMINELSHVTRTIMVFFIYAPSISGNLYLVWQIIFSGDVNGYVNGFLVNYGLIKAPIQFFSDTKYMMPLIIVISLWMSMGVGFLSFIAGLQGLDRSLVEAGTIDGVKNRWQELWYIILPQLKPQLLFGAVMSIVGSFEVGTVGAALTGMPSTDYAVHTVMNHIADYGGSRFDMGYSAAMSTLLFFVMIIANRLVRRLLRSVGS